MKTTKQVLIASLSFLFFSCCTSSTKPISQSEERPSPTDVTNLRSTKPVAGIPLVLFTKSKDKPELNKAELDLATARMNSLNSHPEAKAWDEQMEKATGNTFSRMSFGGSLDTVLALVEDVDDRGEISSIRTYGMFLTTRLSILYDKTSFRPDISEKLLRRLGSIKPSHIEKWKRECDRVLKESKSKVFLAGVLVSVDRFYENDQYSTARAEKYVQRLSQLSKEAVKKWLENVDQYKGTELDAAMNIILIDEFFDKEKFDYNKYVSILNNQK